MFDTRLLDAATTRRFERSALCPLWKADPEAQQAIRRFLKGHLAAATDAGAVEAWWDGTHLRAALFHNRVETSWQGAPMHYVFAESALGDVEAIDWLLGALRRHRNALDDSFELEVFGDQPRLRRGLIAQGYGIEAIVLAGEPRAALDRLSTHYGPCDLPSHLRLKIMTTQAQADAACDLAVRLFTQSPQFCWFGARPDYVVAERISLREKAAAADPLGRVLLDSSDQVVGYFGADLDRGNAHWGAVAGILLTLSPEHQGQGIIKSAYQTLLSSLCDTDCRVFKGGTSQPAVMGLGRLMDRKLVSATFRRNAHFPPEHFAPYLTP